MMNNKTTKDNQGKTSVLTLSTIGFTLMFAVWLMFGVLGIPIRKELGLTDVQLSWLAAIAILNGSLWRLLFGILADRFGGRKVFTLLVLATIIPSYMVSRADTYIELMIWAFFVGMAGNSFSVGISWNSAWYPAEQKGFALGVFGAGNVGASVTKLIGPTLITLIPAAGLANGFIPGGWRFVPFMYCVLLIIMAIAMWVFTPKQDITPGADRPMMEMLKPLKYIRVWRFSLYYVVVFGAYVALSVWLPKYYVDVYGLDLKHAALLTTLFIFPASLLRPLGGYLSDKFGARRIMYWVFGLMLAACFFLSLPSASIVLNVPTSVDPSGQREAFAFSMNVTWFTIFVFIVGVCMGVGKAAVYKYIPEYFPKDVGAVGGLVGMLGALGGFFLPPLFAWFYQLTFIPQSTFFLMFLITGISFAWLHVTVMRLLQKASPDLEHRLDFQDAHE
ncbi:MAG: major facilitator superfamily transporter [Chloroflexi bacterium OLB14]|nr:MAG: major facilitator superfamily transporter [Chloroflexi bacterium OLB14]